MNYFEQPNQRWLEVAVGLATLSISISFSCVLVFFLLKARTNYEAIAIEVALATIISWFSLISYRLLFNKPRQDGGLLCIASFKVWCSFIGVGSIIFFAVTAYNENVILALNSVFMTIACLYGIRIADKRQSKNKT